MIKRIVTGLVLVALGFGVGVPVGHWVGREPCERAFERLGDQTMRHLQACEADAYVLYMARAAADYVRQHGTMPPSAPRTPSTVPRGVPRETPAEVWKSPGWAALHFRLPKRHRFSYELVTSATGFSARAIGDLDGDGDTSLFERAGEIGPDGGLIESVGVYVDREIE